MLRYFLNLTNGIEAVKSFPSADFHFIRIQSTLCEQKQWGRVLDELDYDFLMYLAIGDECVVVDYSAKKPLPRSLYQGLVWIEYVLNLRWLNKTIIPVVKTYNVSKYFWDSYCFVPDYCFKKIDYAKRFLLTDEIKLKGVGARTNLDGKDEAYKEILKGWMK